MKKSGNDFLRVKNFFIINNSLFCSSAIKFFRICEETSKVFTSRITKMLIIFSFQTNKIIVCAEHKFDERVAI